MWLKSYDANWQRLIEKVGSGLRDETTQVRLGWGQMGGSGWLITLRWSQALLILFCQEEEMTQLAQPFCPLGTIRSVPKSAHAPLARLVLEPIFQFFDQDIQLLSVEWSVLPKQPDPCFWIPIAGTSNQYCPVRCLSAPWSLLSDYLDQTNLSAVSQAAESSCTLYLTLGYTELDSPSLLRLQSGGAVRLTRGGEIDAFSANAIPSPLWLSFNEPIVEVINQSAQGERLQVSRLLNSEESMYNPIATGDQMLWTVTAQIGRLNLPIDQLAQLKPGYTIEQTCEFFKDVRLVTRSHLLATGQLLRVGGNWWVEMNELWLPPGLTAVAGREDQQADDGLVLAGTSSDPMLAPTPTTTQLA